MTEKDRLELLDRSIAELKLTSQGYVQWVEEGREGGHWKNAMASLQVLRRDLLPDPIPSLVFPFPKGGGGTICQGVHATAGLTGNYAIDFCDRPNDPVLCVDGGIVQKLSGHPPSEDSWDAQGVYGWSVYIRNPKGYVYYYTHLGRRNSLSLNEKVAVGQILGWVGDQRYRPDHTHIGVTSPLGPTDAKKKIQAVSEAPRVDPR